MDNHISLFFAGDFAPCRRMEQLVLTEGAEVFGGLLNHIENSDVACLNLESPLTLTKKALLKTGPSFKAHPSCARALNTAGFDVVCIANNHIKDYGRVGLLDTINACQSNELKTFGSGRDLSEASKILYVNKGKYKVAFIGVAEHEFSIASELEAGSAPLEIMAITEQIEQAKIQADLVIINIHGGNEYYNLPRPGLREICRYLIRRGADAIMCHHPHVPGAFEIYRDKPIFYSLGNLLFDHSNPPKDWEKGYAVKLNFSLVDNRLIDYELIAYKQSFSLKGIVVLEGLEKTNFFSYIERFNRILSNDDIFKENWRSFCRQESALIMLKNFSPFHFKGMRRISKILSAKVFAPTLKNSLVKLNLIRCESHLELLRTTLEDIHKK